MNSVSRTTWSTGTPRANRKRPQFQATVNADVKRRVEAYADKMNVAVSVVTEVALDEYLKRFGA